MPGNKAETMVQTAAAWWHSQELGCAIAHCGMCTENSLSLYWGGGKTCPGEQLLPSSVAKHEEKDAEYDARDADVDADDDTRRGGFIVLLVLHAVTGGVQRCQKKGERRGQRCCFPAACPPLGGFKG